MGIPEKASHGQGNETIGSWDVALSHESQPRSRNQEDRGNQAQDQEPETQTDDRAERQPPGQPEKFRSLADAKVALHGVAERLVVEFFSASAKRNWEG